MNSEQLNTPLKLLIVEDEAVIQNRLERLYSNIFAIRKHPIKIVLASSLIEAQQILKNQQFHLLSLDLNLNGDSGFDLLQLACSHIGQTIIVSAYRDQALMAFEYGVLDFVAKPFSQKRLEKAIDRLLRKYDDSTKIEISPETQTKYLLVKNASSLLRLDVQDIESIEGYGNYSKIHLQSGQQHLHEKGLDSLLKILPEHFFRVHKSHLVNLHKFQQLKSLGAGQFLLHTMSGSQIPVGRSRVNQLRQRI